jgi:hypothetical protein
MLVACLHSETHRVQTASDLHAAIPGAFNEFGVQIMSRHFMMQPNGSVIVHRGKCDLPRPLSELQRRREGPDRQ